MLLHRCMCRETPDTRQCAFIVAIYCGVYHFPLTQVPCVDTIGEIALAVPAATNSISMLHAACRSQCCIGFCACVFAHA